MGYASRTDRKKPRSVFSREAAWARKMTRREARAKARDAMRNGRHEALADRGPKSTQGWITW